MHYLNVWLTVKNPADVETVRGLLAEAGRLSRTEPGCVRFEVYHSQADPTRFLLSEHWTQKSDWEAHRGAKAYTEVYFPKVIPLVNREAHASTLVE